MDDEGIKSMHFRPVITLGTILVMVGMIGSVIAIIWQASGIAATVQANVEAQKVLIEVHNKSLHTEIGDIKTDVRELRTIILNIRVPEKK